MDTHDNRYVAADTQSHAQSVRSSSGFTAFTHFPAAEAWVERALVERSPIALPLLHQQRFVRYFPWVCAALLPMQLVLALFAFGVLALFGDATWWSGILTLGALALNLAALPGLFRRTKKAWALFSYGVVVTLVDSVLTLSLFAALTGVLCLWLLFQAKQEYGRAGGV